MQEVAGVHERKLSIGPVAATVGLSVRTIRYYEEVGLVTPSGRTVGGFRLYSAADIDRLRLVKRMKPLGYSLEEMARLLSLIEAISAAPQELGRVAEARAELGDFARGVAERVVELRTQLGYAEEFRDQILAVMGGVVAASTVDGALAQASTK